MYFHINFLSCICLLDQQLIISWALLINMALLSLFIVQHSLLASSKVKEAFQANGFQVIYRSVYIIATSGILLVSVYFVLIFCTKNIIHISSFHETDSDHILNAKVKCTLHGITGFVLLICLCRPVCFYLAFRICSGTAPRK